MKRCANSPAAGIFISKIRVRRSAFLVFLVLSSRAQRNNKRWRAPIPRRASLKSRK